MTQWVYQFGGSRNDGSVDQRNLLGGKGANLAEMSRLGLPVPPGFTITTEVCTAFYDNNRQYPDGMMEQVADALKGVGSHLGKQFGDTANPLLVSVRSGARVSMPGMMDTVLNLGLNDETVEGLAALSGDRRFAYDSYRRFIQMYGDVVLGVDHHAFEDALDDVKMDRGVTQDTDLTDEDLSAVIQSYKKLVEQELGRSFPQDPGEQLWGAIGAVFGSWMNARAVTYRRLHSIPQEWGTAVTVQAMVFGNMGDESATGVAFTRNPSTGQNRLYGEFLVNAQGEDVVAGIRTPQSLSKIAREESGSNLPSMEECMPDVFAELVDVTTRLEDHYRDMQDIEFTVERGRLWMLQTRAGKRTARASLKIAVDICNEGRITQDEAVLRIDPNSLNQLLHPSLDPKAERDLLVTGLPASPGAASGVVVFQAEDAEAHAANGVSSILVRNETSPEDIHGMHAATGILTARGGMTSHAAVVARGMGRPCVTGAGAMRIDYAKQTFTVGAVTIGKGDVVTIDGATGQVMRGEVPTIQPELSGDFGTIMGWADARRRLRVRANAETPDDTKMARDFGAEGIGLCRTEHMFFDATRIQAVREMILSDSKEGRRAALTKLLPFQREDFTELFTIMAGLPVTIRLLDPPLHEFLPHGEEEIAHVAHSMGVEPARLKDRLSEMHEVNPMLGHRGCRLGISYPEIYEMQARAILEAACDVAAKTGEPVVPEIMVPLVASHAELEIIKYRINAVADAVEAEKGKRVTYLVGTMIELPRAALQAYEIAASAEFFSFGTNDLTQTVFGISRDDSGRFLGDYIAKKILAEDPFVTLDQEGVGELVRLGAERGRNRRNDLKVGICGEHGGDPDSIDFCERIGLDYVSCSPFRVPIARLAAAQAAIRRSA
ncbi:MAG: pyruvate, phosphate dikinase [Alphaproteobacteria bacterium]